MSAPSSFRGLRFATRGPPLLFVALALGPAAMPVPAQAQKLGDLVIEAPWTRETPKGADVAVGYLVIRNDGAAPDKLLGGTADFAQVEIHEMRTQDGVMMMGELPDGLEVPAHGAVAFAPGGDHLMFTHLLRPLRKGETVELTLSFARAGAVTVEVPVAAVGASAPPAK